MRWLLVVVQWWQLGSEGRAPTPRLSLATECDDDPMSQSVMMITISKCCYGLGNVKEPMALAADGARDKSATRRGPSTQDLGK